MGGWLCFLIVFWAPKAVAYKVGFPITTELFSGLHPSVVASTLCPLSTRVTPGGQLFAVGTMKVN